MFWTRMRNEPLSATLGRQMDLFNRVLQSQGQPRRHRSAPAFNLWSDDTGAVLTSEIPGVTLDSLEITVSGRDVTVKGSRKEEVESGLKMVRKERANGQFERAFQLPYQIDAEKVEARLTNGVLEIVLPRSENDKPRKIAIS